METYENDMEAAITELQMQTNRIVAPNAPNHVTNNSSSEDHNIGDNKRLNHINSNMKYRWPEPCHNVNEQYGTYSQNTSAKRTRSKR